VCLSQWKTGDLAIFAKVGCSRLDVSRIAQFRRAGSMNACASLRFYGRSGEFVRYQLADGLLEGEEIPQRMLERILPVTKLDGKKILIYRDGLFRGQEVRHLIERAKAINTQVILVECIKSGVPRLSGQLYSEYGAFTQS